MQAHVAEQVAEALNITLLNPVKEVFKEQPTTNFDAYEYFLRGKQIQEGSTPGMETLPKAEELLLKAIQLDSTFALAYAWLSINQNYSFHYSDQSPERFQQAKLSYEKALSLDPNLPEAHLAQGLYYYRAYRDYERALESFEFAKKRKPNVWPGYLAGVIRKRQGQFNEAERLLQEARVLNPMDHIPVMELAIIYRVQRQFEKAEKTLKHLISLWPRQIRAYEYLIRAYLSWDENTLRARQVAEKLSEELGPEIANDAWRRIYYFEGNFEKALSYVKFSSPTDVLNNYYVNKATLYYCSNQIDLMQTYADSGRVILEKELQRAPNSILILGFLGPMYAFLGRKEDAIRTGKKAVELIPVSKDVLLGAINVNALAEIYVIVGEYDAAIDLLEYLLSIPSTVTIPYLKICPIWAPLREHPRFKKLLADGESLYPKISER
ncbi:hypothetical protein JW964_10450 [candidate division KSB1 bacterium]|nr:hypothetical protein [candidate division KSB1 bacterium]